MKMEIYKFNCPQCGGTIEAEDSYRGMEAVCPHCGSVILIPALSEVKIENTDECNSSDSNDIDENSGAEAVAGRMFSQRPFSIKFKAVVMRVVSSVNRFIKYLRQKVVVMCSKKNRDAACSHLKRLAILSWSRTRALWRSGTKGRVTLSLTFLVFFAIALGIWFSAASGENRNAGDIKTITLPGGATMELVYCPPGEFVMGSPESEESRKEDEVQHRVRLTRGFWIGKYPVTQQQYESVIGINPSQSKNNENPVDSVSWSDAQSFCERAKNNLRLPTEAEWEYACRAGSSNAYGGTGHVDEIGWHVGNSKKQTHPVGSKKPNAWGIYDMHGNVWEWCSDWYSSYSSETTIDPIGPKYGDRRVDRGGAWSVEAYKSRSAFRVGFNPRICGDSQGFRVACTDGSAILNQKSEGSHDAVNEYEERSSKASETNADLSEYHGPRKFIKEHIKKYDNCRVCAITQAGGDIVVSGANNWASVGCSRVITKRLQEIADSGQRIIDVSLTDQGRFIVLYDGNAAAWIDIPPQMERRLRIYHDNYEKLYSASLNDAGDWIIISSKHFACSDTWLKTWIEDGQEKFGRLLSATVSSDAAVAVFENGFKFFGNVSSELKDALKEASFDVRVIKIAGAAWFFANADGSQYQASL